MESVGIRELKAHSEPTFEAGALRHQADGDRTWTFNRHHQPG